MGKHVPYHTMCFVATWATVTTRINDCKNTIDIAPVYTGTRPNRITTSIAEPEI